MKPLSFLAGMRERTALREMSARFPRLGELLCEIDGMEGAVCALYEGCLTVRLEADAGEYAFFLPMPYREDADAEAALCALEAYAIREELPLVFTDLSEDECTELLARYPLAKTYSLPEDGRYLLYVLTELDLREEIPTLHGERVCLCPPRMTDAALYGALCRDREHLRHFGYSDLTDCPDATDRELVEGRLREWERRTALPFFIYHDSAFVGELSLFAFDGRGGAEISIRLLRRATGRHLASDAMRAALAFAEELGLSRVHARCHRDNLPCRHLLTRTMGTPTEEGELLYFHIQPSSEG